MGTAGRAGSVWRAARLAWGRCVRVDRQAPWTGCQQTSTSEDCRHMQRTRISSDRCSNSTFCNHYNHNSYINSIVHVIINHNLQSYNLEYAWCRLKYPLVLMSIPVVILAQSQLITLLKYRRNDSIKFVSKKHHLFCIQIKSYQLFKLGNA